MESMSRAEPNPDLAPADPADTAAMGEPLDIGPLRVKNRLLRSSISGRIDNYDGSGTPVRIRFEERFAEGGVGAIISSHTPITPRGRVLPHYAMIDDNRHIPFWKEVGERVRAVDGGCPFFMQLSHSGRQQDIAGIENLGRLPDGATGKRDFFHGLGSRRMRTEEVRDVIKLFGTAAERVVKAKLDGIELHSANGYLFTQFLSRAINDRPRCDYGGPLIEDRAQFLLEVIDEVQNRVGKDFPLIVKVTGRDHHNMAGVWPRSDGNDINDAIAISKMVEDRGAHAIHVSVGSMFPHPLNPAGPMPVGVARRTYQSVISSGKRTFLNYLGFRYAGCVVRWLWHRHQPFWKGRKLDPSKVEGLAAEDSKAIKAEVNIPVLVTGGFQTSAGIGKVLRDDSCDAVTIARPLLANPDLPRALLAGQNGPEKKKCSYCNACLLNVLEHPLGCYDQHRFGPTQDDYDNMIADVFEIFR